MSNLALVCDSKYEVDELEVKTLARHMKTRVRFQIYHRS